MRFNKIAALLMASVMTAGAASAMTASAKEYYVKVMKCDINGNGRIDTDDRQKVLDHINGKAAGFRRGNVLNDNYITTDDTDAVLKHIQGKKALSKDAFIRADVNKDNKVDSVDYRKILEYISNK